MVSVHPEMFEYYQALTSTFRELRSGSLLRILDNPEEPAIIEWHPTKPMIACTSLETGSIQIYGIQAAQKCKTLSPSSTRLAIHVVQYLILTHFPI